MYNLVIDLEICNVPRDYWRKSYKYANETIQIGAVLLDENFKRISTLCQFVHPEYEIIDYFIESLTGIRNSQVKNAPRMQMNVERYWKMPDWIRMNMIFKQGKMHTREQTGKLWRDELRKRCTIYFPPMVYLN